MEPATIDVGACRCPGAPHDHDEVMLAPELTVPMGAAAFAALDGTPPTVSAMTAALVAVYLAPAPRGAIVGWTMVDAEGKPEEITEATIARLLPWAAGGLDLAERATQLYAGELFRPLADGRRRSSLRTQTAPSTSVNPASGSERVTPLRRSSRGPTDGTRSEVPA